VNIGVAVALDNGLIVPVIRNADKKSVFNISNEISLLAEKARQNNLKPDDLTEGTFTISNLGMFGVDRFTAIINPPQSAILAVSRAVKKFVPDENGQPVLHPMMTITLSADHRVIDGAIAAQFLSDLRNGLEQPEIIIL
jgi:pyruvate dehydrogenase E2 component (dihydrolipoamide acetyltransferase)